MELSVKMEAVSMIFIGIILMFHCSGKSKSSVRHRLFTLCLIFAEVSVFLDIVTTLMILNNGKWTIPLWVGMTGHMAYFISMNTCFSLVACYAFYVLFDHASDRHCLYKAIRLIAVFWTVLLALMLSNPWTEWFFYFSEGMYIRGPLNRLSYYVVLVELAMFCTCYLRNRSMVGHGMRLLMHTMPPFVLVLAVIQIFIPDVLLNGTTAAISVLILYISFQNHRLYQDSLTELPNRLAFFDELQQRRKKRKKLHMIMIHLKQFESVNQKFGMKKGDEVLYLVARYLDQCSSNYQVFRFRNTRFVLMGTYKGEEEKAAFARKIQKRFREPWMVGNAEYVLRTGIACLVVQPDQKEDSQIVDELEFAVSYAEEQKGVDFICFDDKIQEKFRRRAYVLNQLRHALEKDTLQVYYQPVYNCRTAGFTTAESLLRLFDEKGECISPAEFIPLAEKNGLIDEVSWTVLRRVCQFLGSHPELPLESVSVNLSIQQMEDVTLMKRIHALLNENHLTGKKLCVEITERVMAENPHMVSRVMEYLGQEGIVFYLDDFGTGYSNLASVMRLPFEVVKLDVSLIHGIETEEKLRKMVHYLIRMLHSAGFRIVAEGVESEGQVKTAKELAVDHIQGYYYAQPMPGDQLIQFLAENPKL